MTPDDQIARETAREILAHADAHIEETPTPEEGMRQLAYIIAKALARSREQGEDTKRLDWLAHHSFRRPGPTRHEPVHCIVDSSHWAPRPFAINEKPAALRAAIDAARHPEERK